MRNETAWGVGNTGGYGHHLGLYLHGVAIVPNNSVGLQTGHVCQIARQGVFSNRGLLICRVAVVIMKLIQKLSFLPVIVFSASATGGSLQKGKEEHPSCPLESLPRILDALLDACLERASHSHMDASILKLTLDRCPSGAHCILPLG